MAGASLVVSACTAVVFAVTGAGCVSGECGEGTVRYGNTCVAIDPFDKTPPQIAIDPPLHTREVGIVRLTADEPATIFYTIDGSQPTTDGPHEAEQVVIAGVPDDTQLRYFAVDLAGNRSEEGSRLWIIDRDGPAAPLDFKVALSGQAREVSWTAPPDPRFGGVLVARVEGTLDAGPISGKRHAVGDVLGPGVTVVSISPPTAAGISTFSESLAPRPGIVRYLAWAFDDIHNYGAPAGDYVLVPIPPQTGRVTVNAGTGAVTATAAPSHATVTGSATLAGTTLTLKLAVRNDTTRVLFAPKLLLTNTPAGGTWSDPDGTFDARPYRAYGAAILPGSAASRSWTFSGVSSAATLTMDLDLRDGPVLTTTLKDPSTAGRIVDLATGKIVQILGRPVLGPRGSSTTQPGGITPDGRMLVGSHQSGTVSSFDLVTGKRLATATLRAQKSHVFQVVLDRSGSAAYALLVEGHPNNNNNGAGGGATELVRLDAATLTESGRISLDRTLSSDADISPDGKLLAIATGLTGKGVIIVDLAKFEIKARIVPGFRAQCAVFPPGGGSIVVVGEQIAIYRTSDLMRMETYTTPGGVSGKVLNAVFSSPSTLWVGRRNESATIDLSTGTTRVFSTIPGRMLGVFDGKIYASNSTNLVQRIDPTSGLVESSITLLSNLRGHGLGQSPF